MGLDDRVEVAAVGDIEGQSAQCGQVYFGIAKQQEAGHVGEAHGTDLAAVAHIAGPYLSGRHINHYHAFLLRRHQSRLQGEGDRAQRGVTAHRQAARGFDEQQAEVGILADGWIEDRARHMGVAAGLEHQ
ncbi:hypothetical protein D9M71_601810 [compost metagenome]